ncbi:ARS binding protein Abp2 [Schizosaccharomyces cryophilus OY26]|uniref:ARS binding protein Abp2 n=1 Tax=Schizosaccharomyces cryophilus (strain OY26 / ATCC MYA-4695 / CBS 11777 / NBRC 106824 / NRRL Y48691) TaxID=653667 RepID=S9W0V4_SCHCR|nr:ARS binding protein Abp2 [Schizosaccharomyces cryophilus OY26]EPY53498.1 ARS binding protein Abp2 [Schizosaccharomyces cryophilus OY26]
MNFYALLPSKLDVNADNITEKFCQFCLCCNPWYAGADTRLLANAFNSIPKSEGQKFDIWVLFLLIRQYHQKVISSWSKLVGFLGVERKDEQSTQKIQQYVVRLKRWMNQMHVDAFFDYLLNRPNEYYLEIPESQPQLRSSVNINDDLVIKALRAGLVPHHNNSINALHTSSSPSNWMPSADHNLETDSQSLGFVTHSETQNCPSPHSLLMPTSQNITADPVQHQRHHPSTVPNSPLPQSTNMFESSNEAAQLSRTTSHPNRHETSFRDSESVSVADSIDPTNTWQQWPDELRDVTSPKESETLSDSWSRSANVDAVEQERGLPRKRGRPPGARNKLRQLNSEVSIPLNIDTNWYERFDKSMHAQNTMLRAAFSHAAHLPTEKVNQLLNSYTDEISTYVPTSFPSSRINSMRNISHTMLALVSSQLEIIEANNDRLIWSVHQGPLSATICHTFNAEKTPNLHALAEPTLLKDATIQRTKSAVGTLGSLDTVSTLKMEIAKLNAELRQKNNEIENLKRKVMNAIFN